MSRPSASRVDDLDGLARHGDEDITRLVGLGVQQIFGGRDQSDDACWQFEGGHRLHGADDGSRSGHVVFHVLHATARLDGDATAVEGDALADEDDRLAAALFCCVRG